MKIYTIYKIENHFKLFYNFKTLTFDKRESRLTSENFNTSYVSSKKICKKINHKETLKNWGAQQYSYLEKQTIK